MYKCILRNLFTRPSTPVKHFNAFVLALKGDKSSTATFGLANTVGTKGLRTCSINLCEKSAEITPSDEAKIPSSDNNSTVDVKTHPETSNENPEKTTVLVTENESSLQSLSAVEPEVAKNVQEEAKSGKEGLLDLLGAMKVEVTNKRKLKYLNANKHIVYPPKKRTAPLDSNVSMFEKATGSTSNQRETLAPDLVAAAFAAASTLPNPIQAESELLQQLRQHETISEMQKKGNSNNIGDIIAEMKIGKKPNRSARSANQMRYDDDGQEYMHQRGIIGELDSIRKRRNLFTAKRLNTFSPSEVTTEPSEARLTLWDMDFANQLSTVINQMPRNGFEEMIQWTQQGKMWQYPIDNEAGLEEEASVPFHEHIFLDKHLEEGFPRQGPIRHFMELVVVGLSKNPHLTVQQKKDHIFWFRDYFNQKEEVLKEDDVYLN